MDKLAREALAARLEGMSYGKWKVLHPDGIPGTKEPEPVAEYFCTVCGEPIPQKSSRRKYCSDECYRKKVSHDHYIRRKKSLCVICGNPIPLDSQRTKCCSEECALKNKHLWIANKKKKDRQKRYLNAD